MHTADYGLDHFNREIAYKRETIPEATERSWSAPNGAYRDGALVPTAKSEAIATSLSAIGYLLLAIILLKVESRWST
jgi:hypothetical protein